MKVTMVQRTLFLLLLALSFGSTTMAGEAHLETYTAEDGQRYFTLSLQADQQATPAARDVVIVLDTSASQAGVYRETAIAAVRQCLKGLVPEDRVRLVAADLTARVMNDAFVSPNSDDAEAAIAAILQEPPLGSTDMELALKTATELFDQQSESPRAILYIGDGMSAVNFLQGDEFAHLSEQLRDKQVSVSSYAVGPECDTRLLAALANQTGGNLYVDEGMVWPDDQEQITPQRALSENRRRGGAVGKVLAEWVRAEVAYLADATLPPQLAEIYPQQIPPLRSDRDTVVVGKLQGEVDGLEITATVGNDRLQWTPAQRDASHDLSYLPQLLEVAAKDGGVTLPTVGTPGLVETGRLLLANVDQLTDLAERAVAIGDDEGAAQIVQTVLRRDPGNIRALTVQRLVERNAEGPEAAVPVEQIPTGQAPAVPSDRAVPQTTDPGELSLVRPPQAPAAPRVAQRSLNTIDGAPAADIVRDGSFLTETERRNRVYAEMLQKDVENAISDARAQMRSNPEAAEQNLKLMLEGVRQAPELIAEVRAQLISRLQTVIRETTLAARVKADIDRETEERLAQAREQQLLNDRLARREEHEKQLVARFNALMDEQRYDEAVEVAQIVEEVDPLGTIPVSTELWGRFQRANHLQMVTRELRHRAAFDTWFQVELSSIPFPDEPPIVYPPAAEWIDLTKRREKYKAVDLKSQGGAEERINTALASPLTNVGLNFPETPLSEVVNFLRDEYQIEVQLDTQALDDLGLSPDDTITINLRNISLRSALKLMLKQHDLTYIIADEVLLITSEDEALSRLSVKVYPVADLVLPIETPSTGGFGGGMGGGAFGGGGMMGGGMGGGMMGGGMMGGGMGGGGFGGGAFAVPEDTRDASETAETSAAPTKTTAPGPSPIEIDSSVSPELFWDGYFGSGLKDQKQVRAEVRRLMAKGEYRQVSTLIEAALRHGQPQAWMYESLGIAMQLEGRSKEQIERALLSAADFARSADELCYLGMYLSRSGFDHRALQLYQQVVKLDPSRQEAYPMALRAAERIDDLEGLKWASLGILEQEWPAEQAVVHETAVRHAKAIVERLVKEGRQEEAIAFRDAMVIALQRDCIIRVSWTGDADIDLSVEEPSGTVCSPTNPRTASGGVNLGDAYTGQGAKAQDGVYTETYVCPRGFDGVYRAKIEAAWGKVTADKVTVDVFLHHMSGQKEHQRHQLVLAQNGVGFEFELNNGRRQEPIEQQVIARALKRQEAISKAVLAQQLSGVSDPRVAPLRDAARRDLNRRLLGGQGAVGFQPVIITLPEGTNFMATGVVSADRRYVRITTVPFFSTIGDVSTFTFAGAAQDAGDDDDGGGDNGGDNGGGGGGGGGGGNNQG